MKHLEILASYELAIAMCHPLKYSFIIREVKKIFALSLQVTHSSCEKNSMKPTEKLFE